MKRGPLLFALILVIPASALAKTPDSRATHKARASAVQVASTSSDSPSSLTQSGTLTLSSDRKLEAEIDLYNDLSFIRVEGARPWRVFSRPSELTLTISGLIPGKTYYLYKEKLRNPETFTASPTGSYSLTLPTPTHRYLILKTKPSTYHIDNSATGGDCPSIGTWSTTTKTCTLSATAPINQTIEIDDGDITLDGVGRVISHSDSIGVYANKDPIFDDAMANIVIKNLTLLGHTVGVHLVDVPGHRVENVTVRSTVTGIDLKDDINITLTGNSVEGSSGTGLIIRNTAGVTVTRNNCIANVTDLEVSGSSGVVLDTPTNRGNYWSKFTECTQAPAPANPNHCTNSHDAGPVTDHLPWACKDGWKAGKVCDVVDVPPPPGGGGGGATDLISQYNVCAPGGSYAEIISTLNQAPIYTTADLTSVKLKQVPPAWVVQVTDSTGATFWKIKDLSDNTVGYVEKSKLCTNPGREEEFLAKTKLWNNDADTADRKSIVVDAINQYYNNTDARSLLYTIGGGDGGNNFGSINSSSLFRPIIGSILQDETGLSAKYDNRICGSNGDGGTGLMQLTNLLGIGGVVFEPKGMGSGLVQKIPGNDNCRKNNGYIAKYYGNSEQGIMANVKDGIRVFADKWALADNAEAVPGVSAQEMRLASAIYRYNQGSPFKAQFAYYAWATSTTPTKLLNYLIANGYNNLLTNSGLIGTTTEARITWLQHVQTKCVGITQTRECLEILTKDKSFFNGFTAPPLYLERIGKEMMANDLGSTFENATFGQKLIDINNSQLILSLASPAEIQVVDSSGRKAGSFDGSVITKIPNSVYTPEAESLTLFSPGSSNFYKVAGKADGTYSFSVLYTSSLGVFRVIAAGIHTKLGQIDTYSFDWDNIASGGNGVTVKIDTNGDGIPERTIVQNNEITASELGYGSNGNDGIKDKVNICHKPPGNPGNAHTITIGASAIKAHIAHGDTVGKCDDDGKDKGDKEDEVENNENGDKDDKHEEDDKSEKGGKNKKDDKQDGDKGKSSESQPKKDKKNKQ